MEQDSSLLVLWMPCYDDFITYVTKLTLTRVGFHDLIDDISRLKNQLQRVYAIESEPGFHKN